MPAKKKGGKKKKKEADDDGGAMDPKKVIEQLMAENTALQLALGERQMEAARAIASKRELQTRIEELQSDFKNEQESTHDITSSMTLQYRSMQEGLLNKVNALERTILDLKDQLDFSRMQLEEAERSKQQALAEKDQEIEELRLKMDELASSFGQMLRETLDRMKSRVEVSNLSWEKETGVPMIKKMEEIAGK